MPRRAIRFNIKKSSKDNEMKRGLISILLGFIFYFLMLFLFTLMSIFVHRTFGISVPNWFKWVSNFYFYLSIFISALFVGWYAREKGLPIAVLFSFFAFSCSSIY